MISMVPAWASVSVLAILVLCSFLAHTLFRLFSTYFYQIADLVLEMHALALLIILFLNEYWDFIMHTLTIVYFIFMQLVLAVFMVIEVGWLIYSSQPKGEILPHETVITVISEAKHKEDSEAKEVNRTQLHLLNTKSR